MATMDDVCALIDAQGKEWNEWQLKQGSRLSVIENELGDILKKGNRPGAGLSGNPIAPRETFIDTSSGKRIPVLEHKDSLAALQKNPATDQLSIGRALRGIVLGGRADDAEQLADERKAMGLTPDPSGGYLVSGAVGAQWIDNLRAAMVLSRAGALTVPMPTSELTLAKVTGDPDCEWHKENGALTAGDPTFGAVKLQAKTITCLVKVSLELSQDAANIDQQLSNVITAAVAGEIDRAGLVGVTTNAASAPSGIMNLTGRNSVTSIGAPTSWDFLVDGIYELLLDNVPADQIGAFIAHPAVWKKMRKLKTGITNDNTPLTMPDEVKALPKLWTTSAPLTGGTTAKGIIANWRDLIFGVRQDLQVAVLKETFLGSNLQVAILVHARVDFAATRAVSFCTLEGITV